MQKAFSPIYLVRLSKIIGINDARFKAWAELRREQIKAPAVEVSVPQHAQADELAQWLHELP